YFSVFFFQAEDGIRDYKVTGVQTCALPISAGAWPIRPATACRRRRAASRRPRSWRGRGRRGGRSSAGTRRAATAGSAPWARRRQIGRASCRGRGGGAGGGVGGIGGDGGARE